MWYAFIDERFEYYTTHSRFIVACSFFPQTRWDAQYQDALAVDRARPKNQRIQPIVTVLQKSGGFAVLAYADVPDHLAQAGETDGTADIPSMKRRDNLWSQLVVFAVTTAVACLHGASLITLDIDVFYDPKSLTPKHRLSFEEVLRDTLSATAKDTVKVLGSTAPVYFHRIEQVPKRRSGEKSNALQDGINISHHLCTQSKSLITSGGVTGIVVHNCTDVVIDTISKFV